MTRTVQGCSLALFSIVLAGCSMLSPTKPADGGTAPANPTPTPVATAAAPASAPAAAPAAVPVSAPVAAAPSGPVLMSQDINQPGITADFTECKRKEGVLNVRLRFRNVSSKEINFNIVDNFNFAAFYVTAASKKYFILKDSEGTYLAPQGQYQYAKLAPGEQFTWWAKYPAPPPEVKKITFMTPISPPFEDVPITDQ